MVTGMLGSAKASICPAMPDRIVDAGEDVDAVVDEIARFYRQNREPFSGFGHPVDNPVEPRSVRIFELAETYGIARPHFDLAKRFPAAVETASGKPIPMNVQLPMAVLLEPDFPAPVIKAIRACAGGLLAHLAEESASQTGFQMAHYGAQAIDYVRGEGDRE